MATGQTAKKPKLDDDAWRLQASCSSVDIFLFFRQLAALLKCGVQVVPALESLAKQSESSTLARALDIVQRKVSDGFYLSQGMAHFPKLFREVHIAMIRIGEQTGGMVPALENLAWLVERDFNIQRKVKGALAYPALVLSSALVLTALLFYTILPGFVTMFEEMHMSLPLVTRLMVLCVHALTSPLFLALALALAGGAYLYFKKRVSRSLRYRWLGAIPVLGMLIRESAVARFCSAMEATLNCGVDVCRALELSSQASSHPWLVEAGLQTVRSVRDGLSLSQGLDQNRKVYGSTLPQMVRAAEESNHMSAAFGYTARCCNAQLEHVIDNLGATLEPLLLGGVALITGTLLVSIFLPLYSYAGSLAS